MKKTVIATGLGVAALAAMPLLSTFALEGTMQRTDHLTVTIDKGCTFTADATEDAENTVILAQGASAEGIKGVVFNITCPTASGDVESASWQLTATGLDGSNKLSDGAGHDIASSGGVLDGSSSNWAFKLVGTGAAKIESGYDVYTTVPNSAKKVASGDEMTEGDSTVKAFYGVSASKSQEPGTYTGGVTYTLTSTVTESEAV